MNKFKFLTAVFLSIGLGATVVAGAVSDHENVATAAHADNTPETLYLWTNENWRSDDARFAAYFFGDSGNIWASMDAAEGGINYVYSVGVPTGYDSVIFCRMKSGTEVNNWDNRWDQSVDLTIPTDGKNCFTVSDGAWNNANGTWGTIGVEFEYNLVAEITDIADEFSYGVNETSDVPDSEHLYLTPNSNWKVDNARFAAYFFGGSGNTWSSMEDSDGDGIYEVQIPAGYPNVIFCRMNPSTTDNNWNDGVKWNQTADLVIPTDGKNHYTVKEGTWNNGGGTWSTVYVKSENTVQYPIDISNIKNYFHLFNSVNGLCYKWQTKEAVEADENFVYLTDSSALLVLTITSVFEFDKVIFTNSIDFDTNSVVIHDEWESEQFDLDDYGNNQLGITINSSIYNVTEAEKCTDSADRTNAYRFLKKFHELGRVDGDVCDAVEDNYDLYYECAAIYNSFKLAKYVDGIEDVEGTIGETMKWLITKYGLTAGEAASANKNVLYISKNINDSSSLIILLVAISLIGVTSLIIVKRKRAR